MVTDHRAASHDPAARRTATRRAVLASTAGVGLGAWGISGAVGRAASLADPDVLWEARLDSGARSSSPTVLDGTVYVGTTDLEPPEAGDGVGGAIYAFDVDGGDELWSVPLQDAVLDSPHVVDGVVYVPTSLGTVYALDAESGDENWTFEPEGGAVASATVVGDLAYVNGHHRLYAIDVEDGDEVWSADLRSGSSPTIVDGTVYVGSGHWQVEREIAEDEARPGRIVALETDTGDEAWTVDTGQDAVTSPTVAHGTVVAIGTNWPEGASVHAVAAPAGEETWADDLQGFTAASPTVADGTVFIGDAEGLYAFDLGDGTEVWRFDDRYVPESSPTVVKDVVLAASLGNVLSAIDIDSGEELWSVEIGTTGPSSPTVADGVAYLGTGEGLVAIDTGLESSSDGSRVSLGTLGHHDGWTGEGVSDAGPFGLGQRDGASRTTLAGAVVGGLAVLGGAGYVIARRFNDDRR